MRKKHIKLLLLLLMPVIIFSCVKETDDNIDKLEKFYLNNPDAIAQVKFIHAYTPLTLGGAPAQSTSTVGFRITMDGNKINGAGNASTSTNTFMYGGVYPPTTAYSFLAPGPHNFRFIMNRVAVGNFSPVTGDEYFNTTLALTAGKKYSMFIADPYTTAYMVEDNFKEPVLGHYGLRFINVTAETNAKYDIVSARHGTKLFSNVGYKEMKDYIYLTTTSTDTIYMKTAGTNTVVSQINGFLPGTQRVYTLYARGKTGVTGRTPNLTFYTNR